MPRYFEPANKKVSARLRQHVAARAPGSLRHLWFLCALGEGSGWDPRVRLLATAPAAVVPAASGNLGIWEAGNLEIWNSGNLESPNIKQLKIISELKSTLPKMFAGAWLAETKLPGLMLVQFLIVFHGLETCVLFANFPWWTNWQLLLLTPLGRDVCTSTLLFGSTWLQIRLHDMT